ncbi:LOW QUALITY PROTEIN: hypothetical protein CVT26_011391 [Gymnopilus dilepis]|uniref:Phospholipid:diacylglycerol acyltransferase n=1 Tax=Gymnopilus dilepis TaxID=231916 RepID=A0A409YHC8_9AGAR|nr:LOW QUALITY PROTEIN: hypothetical protein CVT26_011391 [Gymnopilus dilepis]
MVLFRRSKGRSTPADAIESSSRASSSSESLPEGNESKEELKSEVVALKKATKRPFYAKSRFLFPVGIFLGILLGFAFVEPKDLQDLHIHVTNLANQYDINLPQLPDIDMSRLEVEFMRFRSSIPEVWKFNNDGREFQVGEKMKARGLNAKYPVVLIPGVISTSLESWSTTPEYRPFFREKVWGGFSMLSQVTFNKERWISAMMLDPVTGLDPADAKVRAAEGIDAASSLIQGYWIWSKIVENLAVVNYDTNNLYLAPYDWRLSYYNLEERDGYFSRLKTTIEGEGKSGRLLSLRIQWAVLFKWVESPDHGNGGPEWVENHIEGYIAIAGTHLEFRALTHTTCSCLSGSVGNLNDVMPDDIQAKAMAAFLSGEMKDTVQMNPAGSYGASNTIPKLGGKCQYVDEGKHFYLISLHDTESKKGGNDVWGNATHAPDDECDTSHSHGELIAFRPMAAPPEDQSARNMTVEEASNWILEHTPTTFQKMLETNYSHGIERDETQLKRNNADHRKWSNPLEVSLPYAPSMKIYCVYGHGKETERSYCHRLTIIRYARGQYEQNESFPDTEYAECEEPENVGCVNKRPPLDLPLSRVSWIDAAYTNETTWPKVRNGVKIGEGDGTVSLLSLGAMCVEGWKRKRWNPAGIPVTTVELPHRPNPTIPRGGANTSDHVDILGSTGLNEIILKVATGAGAEIEDSFVSNIREYSRKIKWD